MIYQDTTAGRMPSRFVLPLRRLAQRMPRPSSAAFAALLNVALRRDLPDDVYRQLIGRGVEIAVSDWGLRLRVCVMPRGFMPVRGDIATDLCISASARDFALLASGDEDPDTLYFDRRVVVEGDTELALLIKNTLDALPARRTRNLIRRLHRGMDHIRSLRTARAGNTRSA